METALICIGPILVIGFILVLYLLPGEDGMAGSRSISDRRVPQNPTDDQTTEPESTLVPIYPTPDYGIDENGAPDRLGGTLYILDEFVDAVASFGTDSVLPLSQLPASPELIERTLTELLIGLKDAEFRKTISLRCWDHEHILEDRFQALLRVHLVHNLPRFVPSDHVKFMNSVFPPVSAPEEILHPEEISSHLEKLGLSDRQFARAHEMFEAQNNEKLEIDKRLQSKGI